MIYTLIKNLLNGLICSLIVCTKKIQKDILAKITHFAEDGKNWVEMYALDPLVKLDHVGHFTFEGNVSKMFYSSSPEDANIKA